MRKVALMFVAALWASASFSLSSCGQITPPTDAVERKEGRDASQQPQPEDLLRRMANYLAELPAFACRVTSTIEIKAQGMENRLDTKIAVRIERPNRLSLLVEQGVMGVTVVSDGKQLFQYLPALNRYVVRDAPEDLSGLAEIGGTLGIPAFGGAAALIPTDGDEFYKALTDGVTKSEYLGTEKIGAVLCHRCRFARDDFSWDIWIETGERPLVHKLEPDLSKQFTAADGALADTKLQWTITLSDWDVSPKFTTADFSFTPPADAEKVDSLFAGLGEMADEGPHPLLGQPAPAFQTVDLDGQPIDLQQHLGKKMILLDFWATWCGPCIRAMPDVDAVAEKYADQGLAFYAVNVGEDPAAAKEFLTESKLDVPVAVDPDGKISELYQVDGIPQTVLIGKDGTVQVVYVGFNSELGKQLSQNIEDLLAGKDLAGDPTAEPDEASRNFDEESPSAEAANESQNE